MSYTVEQLKSGDQAAFSAFVEEYQNKVYRTAWQILLDEHLAYDAAQEVFLKVYSSLAGFKGQSALGTWVYRITVNTALDMKRKLKRQQAQSLTVDSDRGEVPIDVEDTAPTPEQRAEQAEERELLQRAIGQLNEHHRAVLVLRDVKGLSYQEIAQILGCSEGTMKSRLKRARDALQTILKSEGYFHSP